MMTLHRKVNDLQPRLGFLLLSLAITGLGLPLGVLGLAGQEIVILRILDEDRRPLPAASVVIYHRTEQSLSEVPLSSDGTAALERTSLSNSFLRISHLGYETRILDRPEPAELKFVVLARSPLKVEGIVGTAERRPVCRPEEPRAERVLATTAIRYGRDPSSLVYATYEVGETVSESGEAGRERRRPESKAWYSASLRDWGASKVQERVAERGWVWRGPFGEVVLPDFAGIHAAYFVSEGFRVGNRVWFEREGSGETVLGFCGEAPERTELRGRLLLGQDGLVEQAVWELWWKGDLFAWGDIDFLEPPPGGAQLPQLLPIRGRTWLRLGRKSRLTGGDLIRLLDVVYKRWTVDGVVYPSEGALDGRS